MPPSCPNNTWSVYFCRTYYDVMILRRYWHGVSSGLNGATTTLYDHNNARSSIIVYFRHPLHRYLVDLINCRSINGLLPAKNTRFVRHPNHDEVYNCKLSWPRHNNYNIILRMITVRIIKGIIIPLLLLLSIIHMHFKCIPDRIWIPRIYFALLLLLFTLYYVHCIDF